MEWSVPRGSNPLKGPRRYKSLPVSICPIIPMNVRALIHCSSLQVLPYDFFGAEGHSRHVSYEYAKRVQQDHTFDFPTHLNVVCRSITMPSYTHLVCTHFMSPPPPSVHSLENDNDKAWHSCPLRRSTPSATRCARAWASWTSRAEGSYTCTARTPSAPRTGSSLLASLPKPVSAKFLLWNEFNTAILP